MDSTRSRTWAEVDLSALHANLAVIRRQVPGADVLAVVKANAYGHGLTQVCQSLADDVAYFGVAALSEASIISKALKERTCPPILLLGSTLPEELPKAIAQKWQLSVSTVDQCQEVVRAAKDLHTLAKVHLVIDTGMGRIGALQDQFLALCQFARSHPNLVVQGLATHLSSADEDIPFTQAQLAHFDKAIDDARSLWPDDSTSPHIHVLNSAGVCRFNQATHRCLVRPGLMLYGCAPEPEFQEHLSPVMTIKSRVRLIRDLPTGHSISYGHTYVTSRPTSVGTVSIGYGDGYPRSLSGQETDVLIRGTRCPLLGRVTMDQIMVDVSGLQQAACVGDEVVLLGSQGNSQISLWELADKAASIPWEILTRVTGRVCRQHLEIR